jgi:hypothetical protein
LVLALEQFGVAKAFGFMGQRGSVKLTALGEDLISILRGGRE